MADKNIEEFAEDLKRVGADYEKLVNRAIVAARDCECTGGKALAGPGGDCKCPSGAVADISIAAPSGQVAAR